MLPPCFRAHKGIAHNDWDTSSQRDECQEAMKYLMRTHINTQHSANFGKEIDKDIWNSEYWATTFVINKNQTPLVPECRYMAAALFLADMNLALLCEGRDKGFEAA